MANRKSTGAPAPSFPAPAGSHPIWMPSDESYMPGGYGTAALMVDKTAALQTLVALCRVRVERIQTLTSIARAWSPEGTDGQAQIGFLLEPTAYELDGLLEVIADRAAALEGGAA